MGWEDAMLPQTLRGLDTGVAPAESLIFEERQRQMTPNHDLMRLELWYRGRPDEEEPVAAVRRWFREQLTEGHQGEELLSTVYSGFYEIAVSGITLEAQRRDDAETLRLCRLWWRDHTALYWHLRTPELRVVTPGARSNRPAEWGQGAVLRALLGQATRRDDQVGSDWKESSTPQLWAVRRILEAGALRVSEPQSLESTRPVLSRQVTVWRNGDGHGEWAPVLVSPRSIAQWGAYVDYRAPATYGEPEGSNPIYTRGRPHRGRRPQQTPEVPPWIARAKEMEARGEAARIEFGPGEGEPASVRPRERNPEPQG
jgi:hypothetical protein